MIGTLAGALSVVVVPKAQEAPAASAPAQHAPALSPIAILPTSPCPDVASVEQMAGIRKIGTADQLSDDVICKSLRDAGGIAGLARQARQIANVFADLQDCIALGRRGILTPYCENLALRPPSYFENLFH
jgi:hypothetical protein